MTALRVARRLKTDKAIQLACARTVSLCEKLENRTLLSTTMIDHSTGFASLLGTSPDMSLNGTAMVTSSTATPPNALQLTSAANSQTGSAFSNDAQGVDTFDTTFDFTYGPTAQPQADGFTFTLQNAATGPMTIGGGGGNLGYGGITPSVAVKFDIYPNESQTGVYVNGQGPTDAPVQAPSASPAPIGTAIDLTAGGINFHNNAPNPNPDVYKVHLVYDGTRLTETVTDTTAAGMPSVTQTYTINIPATVGGQHTAFAGFTGATGGLNSEQDILDWKYTGTNSGTGITLPAPALNQTPCLPGTAMLSWGNVTGSETGFDLERSSDNGATFSSIASLPAGTTSYTDTGLSTTQTYQYKIKALGNGTTVNDSPFSNVVSVNGAGLQVVPISHPSGFAGADNPTTGDLKLNSAANIVPSSSTTAPPNALQLITGNPAGGEVGSAWDKNVQFVNKFNTTFDFTFGSQVPPDADGFTFTIQDAPTGTGSLGGGGGNLGYQGIPNSVAVKFDLYDGNPAGAVGGPATGNNTYNATGVYINGAGPTDDPRQGVDPNNPAPIGTSVDLKTDINNMPTGIDFHANPSDTYKVNLAYDGTTLTEAVTDVTKNITVKQTYAIDIPTTIGSPCAYVGFTAADGGAISQPNILDWIYSQSAAAPHLTGTTFSDGSTASQVQRSEVRQITLTFDQAVTLGTGAVSLSLLNTGGSGKNDGSSPTDVSAALSAPTTPDGGKTWVFTFNKTDTTSVDSTGSLVDGIYTVTVDPTKVSAQSGGAALASSGSSALSTTFHRLFGDVTGSKTVNNGDYLKFKQAYLTSTGNAKFNADFDYDGNGTINNADFLQFKKRYLKTFTYA